MAIVSKYQTLGIKASFARESNSPISVAEAETAMKVNAMVAEGTLTSSTHQNVESVSLRSGDREITLGRIDINAICPVTGYTRLHQAILDGQIGFVRRLLNNGAKPLSNPYDGNYPLHLAAAEGNIEILHLLHEESHPLDVKDCLGQTPLDHAISMEKPEAIKALLAMGADPTITDELGQTSLEKASSSNAPSCLQVLLEGARGRFTDEQLNHALGTACLNQDIPSARLLIEHGADLTAMTDEHFNQAQLLAARILAHVTGINPDNGKNPLWGASGHYMAIPYLDAMNRAQVSEPERFGLSSAEHQTLQDGILEIYTQGSPEELYDRIQNGELTFINTGWNGHAVSLCFYDGYMTIANTGQGGLKNGTLKVYKIDPSLVSPEMIEEIQNLKSGGYEEGARYLYDQLPRVLSKSQCFRIQNGEFTWVLPPQTGDKTAICFFNNYMAVTNPNAKDADPSLELFKIDPAKMTSEKILLLKEQFRSSSNPKERKELLSRFVSKFSNNDVEEKDDFCQKIEKYSRNKNPLGVIHTLRTRPVFKLRETKKQQNRICHILESIQPIPQEHGFCSFESKRASIGAAWALIKLKANPTAAIHEVLHKVNDFHNYTVKTAYKRFGSWLKRKTSSVSEELKSAVKANVEYRRETPLGYFMEKRT